LKSVTEEHQDPALEVEGWIRDAGDKISIDDVVLRLLTYPPAVVTLEEERAIPPHFRRAGAPGARYAAARIELQIVAVGTAEFFRRRNGRRGRTRRGKYHVDHTPFESCG
jgi:hypothetical protein